MTDYSKYYPESGRLQFLADRDGIEGAIEFAGRTMVSYRRAVVLKKVPRENRRGFIQSYLAFKQFLRDNK